MKQRILAALLAAALFMPSFFVQAAELSVLPMLIGDVEANAEPQPDLGLTAKAALLMEASTGSVLYEKNGQEPLHPASITKIMTLLLIFDALETGRITLEEQVTTSAYAKSMGGSQVFLEEGEVQTVETLIKCIVIASGNDASVAMAEYLCGSETEFVRQMNERAAGLGMTETNFEDCCGLTESETHRTCARDVALMSRELITKYPQIQQYATIWMENITHVTKRGSSEFCLTNTNKLLKMNTPFEVTGLKTGSTSQAKYCVSATARQDGLELIAVVMAAPNYKDRFSEAVSMLQYGFGRCSLYRDVSEGREPLPTVPVRCGSLDSLALTYEKDFFYLSMAGEDFSRVEQVLELPDEVKAPVEKGQVIGTCRYLLQDKELGQVNILAAETVERAGFFTCLEKVWQQFLRGSIAF